MKLNCRKIICGFVLIVSILCLIKQDVKAIENIVHQGKFYGLDWSINSEGVLYITGAGENYPEYDFENYKWLNPDWYEYREEITYAIIDVDYVLCCRDFFCGCKNLTGVEFRRFDCSNVEDMSDMFRLCENLRELSVSDWDVGNVRDLSDMFFGCKKLKELSIENWNVSSVQNMSGMFMYCENLTELPVSNWNVANVQNMNRMFCSCKRIQELPVSNWSVSNVRDMSDMFNACNKLQKLSISNWNVSNVQNMGRMFMNCRRLQELPISNWNVSNVCDMERMFFACGGLTSLSISNWNVSNVIDMSGMFGDCVGLAEIPVYNWNVSNVQNMSTMFYDCFSLTKIDLSKWNVSNVTSMSSMFLNCYNLEEIIGIENWNTMNVTDLSDCFNACSSIKKINLNSWNVSQVSDFRKTFYACYSLESLQIDKWNLESADNIEGMFAFASNIRCKLTLRNQPTYYDNFCYQMNEGAYVIVNYTGDCTKEFAEKIIDIPEAKPRVWVEGSATSIDGYSLGVGDDISVNLYIKMSPEYFNTNTYMLCEIDGNRYLIENFDSGWYNEQGYFRCKIDIPPAIFNQKMNCKLYSNGNVVSSKEICAMDYAKIILNNVEGKEEFRKAQPVVNAILNYAGYCQRYFNRNITNLANKDLYTESTDPISKIDMELLMSYDKVKLVDTTNDVNYVGMSLCCDGSLKVRLYFTYTQNFKRNISNYSIENYYEGVDGRGYRLTDKYLIIEIKDINYSELTDKFRIDIYKKSDKDDGIVLVGSPMSYIMLAEQSSNTILKKMNRAMYILYCESEKYKSPIW